MPRGISRHRAAEQQTTLLLDSRTKSAFGSDQNDLDMLIGTCYNLSTSGGARSITGMTGGTEGRIIQLVNVGSDYIYLVNESTGSIAVDRILTALPAGAQFELAPNQSIFLSYNNVVNRWLVMHASVMFDPETDTPLATILGGLRGLKRSGGLLSALQGFLKAAITSKVSGDTGNQAFGAVTGAQVSFTMPRAGTAIIAVCGSLKTSISTAIVQVVSSIGGRFDSDAALAFNTISEVDGAGGDYIDAFPLFGIWGKSLAAGSHTADLCWGETTGNYGLYSNASLPASIAVFYPG
jgi:hypothetical protein